MKEWKSDKVQELNEWRLPIPIDRKRLTGAVPDASVVLVPSALSRLDLGVVWHWRCQCEKAVCGVSLH